MYNERVQKALDAGYSLDDVRSNIAGRYTKAIEAGYPQEEVREAVMNKFGMRIGTTQGDLDDAEFLGSLMFMEQPKAAESLGEAVSAGYQNSLVGLGLRGEMPDIALNEDAPMSYHIAAAATQALGDLPGYISGALAGLSIASAATVATGGAAALAAPATVGGVSAFATEYARQALVNSYREGRSGSFMEYLSDVGSNMLAGAKGGVVGAVGTGAGTLAAPLAGKIAGAVFPTATSKVVDTSGKVISETFKTPMLQRPLAGSLTLGTEVAAMTTAMSTQQGRLPTATDFVTAGAVMLGMKASGLYTGKTASKLRNYYTDKAMDLFETTGMTPAQFAKASLIDPSIVADFAAINTRPAAAYKPTHYILYADIGKAAKGQDVLTQRGVSAWEARSRRYTDEDIELLRHEVPIDPQEFTGVWLDMQLSNARSGAQGRIKTEDANRAAWGAEVEQAPTGTRADYLTPNVLLEEVMVPRKSRILNLVGNTDAIQVELFKKYAETEAGKAELGMLDPEFGKATPEGTVGYETIGETRLVPTAKKVFESLTPEFQQFLKSHVFDPNTLHKVGGGFVKNIKSAASVDWEGIRITEGTSSRMMIFNPKRLSRYSKSPIPDKATADLTWEEAAAKIDEHVSIGENPGTTIDEIWSSVMTRVYDRVRPLNIGAKGDKLTEPYRLAINSMGAASMARHMIDFGTFDFNYTNGTRMVNGRGLASILKQVDDSDMLSRVLTALSFKDMAAEGVKIPMPADEVAAILAKPEAKPYLKVAEELTAYRQRLLKYQYDAGLITKRAMDNLNRQFKNGLPLAKLIESYIPELSAEVKNTKGLLERGVFDFLKSKERLAAEKELRESRVYEDPLESLIKLTYLTTKLAEQNRVKASVARTFGSMVKPEDQGKGIRMSSVTYSEAGKTKTAIVPKAIADAAYQLDVGMDALYNPLVRGIAKATNVFRAGTTITPQFAVSNLFRDQPTAWIQSRVQYTQWVDAFRGLGEIFGARHFKAGGKDSYENVGAALTAERGKTAGTISGLEKSLAETDKALARAEKLSTDDAKALEAAHTKVVEAERFFDDVSSAYGDPAKTKLTDFTTVKTKAVQMQKDYTRQYNLAKSQLANAQKEYTNLSTSKLTRKAEVNRYTARREQLAKDLEAAKNKSASLQSSAIEEAQKRIEALEQKAKEAETEYNEMAKDHDEAIKYRKALNYGEDTLAAMEANFKEASGKAKRKLDNALLDVEVAKDELVSIQKSNPIMDNMYAEWMRSGGGTVALMSVAREFSQEAIKDLTSVPMQNVITKPWQHASSFAKFVNPISWGKAGYKAMSIMSEMSDTATRVGVYKKARKEGYSPEDASFISREATMDFNRAGTTVRAWNMVSAFLNARVQGMGRMVEAMKQRPLETTARAVAGLTIPSFLLAVVQQDYMANNPDTPATQTLKEMQLWRRVGFFNFVVNDDFILSIPKPHEWALAFCSPVEAFVEWAYRDGDAGFMEALNDVGAVEGFVNAVNFAQAAMPTVAAPVVEVATNHSFFTGNQVVPTYMAKQLPSTQYRPGTSTVARAVSDTLNKIYPLGPDDMMANFGSPIAIDHIVRGWTGSLGTSIVQVLSAGLDASGLYEQVAQPTKTLAELPFFRSFLIKYPTPYGRSAERFNIESARLEAALTTYKALATSPSLSDQAKAAKLLNDMPMADFTSMRKSLGMMNKAVRAIHMHPDFTPDEKRTKIDQIFIQMTKVYEHGNAMIDQIKKQFKQRQENQDAGN